MPCTGATGGTGQPGPNGQQGVRGQIGQTGPVGPVGSLGPLGATGPQGQQGPIGFPGDQGATGVPGDTGSSGPRGNIGDPGQPGQVGSQGQRGDSGDTGAIGSQGQQGDQGASSFFFCLCHPSHGSLEALWFRPVRLSVLVYIHACLCRGILSLTYCQLLVLHCFPYIMVIFYTVIKMNIFVGDCQFIDGCFLVNSVQTKEKQGAANPGSYRK